MNWVLNSIFNTSSNRREKRKQQNKILIFRLFVQNKFCASAIYVWVYDFDSIQSHLNRWDVYKWKIINIKAILYCIEKKLHATTFYTYMVLCFLVYFFFFNLFQMYAAFYHWSNVYYFFFFIFCCCFVYFIKPRQKFNKIIGIIN